MEAPLNCNYYEKACRICLSDEVQQPLTSLFDGEDGVEYHKMIHLCTTIQIFASVDVPNSICNLCLSDLRVSYGFKRRCETSEDKLTQYVQKLKITAKSISLSMDDPLFPMLHDSTLPPPSDIELKLELGGQDNNGNISDNSGFAESDDEPLRPPPVFQDAVETNKKTPTRNSRAKKNDVDPIKTKIPRDRNPFDPKKNKKCPICARGFSKSYHVKRHLKTHEKDRICCTHCDANFYSVDEHKVHLLTHGDVVDLNEIKSEDTFDLVAVQCTSNGNKICICQICDQEFKRIHLLRQHLLEHTYQDLCTRNLSDKPHLFHGATVEDDTDDLNQYLEKLIQNKVSDQSSLVTILNANGFEMSLSDSETDSESEQMNPIQIRRIYQCPLCARQFMRLHQTIEHMRRFHTGEHFDNTCNRCGLFFPDHTTLFKHWQRQCENTTKQFSCTVCCARFMLEMTLLAHVKMAHPGKVEALHAAQQAAKKDSVVVMVPGVGNKGGDAKLPGSRPFACDVCLKSFTRVEHLSRHSRIHCSTSKEFSCDVCNKKFTRKDNMKSHMLIHSDVKEDNRPKHLCIYCGRSFTNSSNLIVHMRRHTGEKPYKCDLCDKGFPRSSDLQCHRRTHTGEKPCLCTICGKGFSRSNKLVRHMRIHTGVRPYKCPHCDRAFTQSNDLTLHIRRHTGDKPYVCGICGQRFIQGTALQNHRRASGHFEEQQETQFSSISVNNPHRVMSNSYRVNPDPSEVIIVRRGGRKKAAALVQSATDDGGGIKKEGSSPVIKGLSNIGEEFPSDFSHFQENFNINE